MPSAFWTKVLLSSTCLRNIILVTMLRSSCKLCTFVLHAYRYCVKKQLYLKLVTTRRVWCCSAKPAQLTDDFVVRVLLTCIRFLHLDAQGADGWDQLPVSLSRIDSTQILGASTDSQGNHGDQSPSRLLLALWSVYYAVPRCHSIDLNMKI